MSKLSKTLVLPFAIVAMLFLGALTISASNVTEIEVNNVKTAAVDYVGKVFIPDVNNLGSYIQIGTTDSGCTLEILSETCMFYDETTNTDVQVWGLYPGSTNDYRPLYTIVL